MLHARAACTALVASLFISAFARADDVAATWDGSANPWSNAPAWSLPTYPNNNSPAGTTYALTVNAGAIDLSHLAPTINSLTWTGGTITSQSISRNGDTVTGGQLTVQNTATLSGPLTLGGDYFVLNGTTTIGTTSPTTLSEVGSTASFFNNGSLTIGNQTTLNGGLTVYNAGTADISAANDIALAPLGVNNTGTVALHSGTISTAYQTIETGDYSLDAGATLSLNAQSFSSTSSISGQGNVLDTAAGLLPFKGTYTITGTTTVSGADTHLTFYTAASTGGLTVQGGSIAGTSSFMAAGPVSWTGGSINFIGGLTASGPVTLNPSSATLGGSFTIAAGQTFTFGNSSDPTTLTLKSGASLTSNGPWNAGPGTIMAPQATSSITPLTTNAGTLTINAPGSSLAFVDSRDSQGALCPLSFTNSGLINVNAGELILAASGHPSLDGSIHVASGATLAIAAKISLDGSITGDGNLLISSALTDTHGDSTPYPTGPITFNGAFSLAGTTTISNVAVAFNANTTLNNLSATGTSFTGPATLTVGGTSTWNDVALTNASVLITGSVSASYLNAKILALDGTTLSTAAGATLTLSHANSVTFKNSAAFTNNGTLSLSSNSTAFAFTSGSAQKPGGSFTNNGTINATDSLAFSSSITFTNNGIINISHGSLQVPVSTDTANAAINIGSAASLILGSRSFNAGTLNNAGSILTSLGGATATLDSALTFINSGTLTIHAGTLLLAASQQSTTSGNFDLAPDGILELAADYDFASPLGPTLTGSGLLIIDPGITLTLASDSDFAGTIEDNGTLVIAPPRNPANTDALVHFTILPPASVPEPASILSCAVIPLLLTRRRRTR